jgi:RNA polymerase sigma-70 factor (ECF subfamily)
MEESARQGLQSVEVSAADLVEAIAARRDREAFKRLFADYAPRIKAFGRRMGANAQAADDLAQDVLLSVWRRAGQFDRRKASVSTWIFTIARNRRIDVIRRDKRPEFDPSELELRDGAEPQPDEALILVRRQSALRELIAELPEEQSIALRLAYFDDKPHGEIAAQLNVPLGTVKSRIRLAMTKLRATIKEGL